MKEFRIIAIGFVCLCIGALATSHQTPTAYAQQEGVDEAQAWEIHHGSYVAPAGGQDDAPFYVVRHNRQTGQTQYVGCEDRDGCTLLSVEVQD